MVKSAALGCAVLIAVAGSVSAQQSLFGQPAQPDAPAAEAAPTRAPAKKARAKPKGPVPARSLVISNASANVLTELELSAEGKTVKLAKPLAPKGRATLKLPALKRCTVTVSAAFEGSGAAEANDYDICKEKSIRFTD